MKTTVYKFKQDALKGIVQVITYLLVHEYTSTKDKLAMAVLAEVKYKFERSLLEPRPEYKFRLPPQYKLALSLIPQYVPFPPAHYLGNVLHQLSSSVHQQYS